MGTTSPAKNSSWQQQQQQRSTTDDFANSVGANSARIDGAGSEENEEESIAYAIAALSSMPRNCGGFPQASSPSSPLSASKERPRSATQAAMKTKCPTRTTTSRSASSSKNGKNKQEQQMLLLLQQQQQQPPPKSLSFQEEERNDQHEVRSGDCSPAAFRPPFAASAPVALAPAKRQQKQQQIPTAIEKQSTAIPSTMAPIDAAAAAAAAAAVALAQHQRFNHCQQPQQQPQPDAPPPPPHHHHHHPQQEDATGSGVAGRLARSRERNREHARRTRLRKKAALQDLQARIAHLRATRASLLQQQVQDQSIASILLGLTAAATAAAAAAATTATTSNATTATGGGISDVSAANSADPGAITPVLPDQEPSASDAAAAAAAEQPPSNKNNKRKRSQTTLQQNPLQVQIAGKGTVTIQSQVNWKTGTYMDEAGLTQQLNPEELEILRRERNRRHAKMTRDRKKNLLLSMEQTVEELEREIEVLRRRNSGSSSSANNNNNNAEITPLASPELQPEPAPNAAAAAAEAAAASTGHPAPYADFSLNNHHHHHHEESAAET